MDEKLSRKSRIRAGAADYHPYGKLDRQNLRQRPIDKFQPLSLFA